MEKKFNDNFIGLTTADVENRIRAGQVNFDPNAKHGKTVKEIVLSNTITFFNILNLVFFVLIMAVGSFKNGAFGILLLINTGIGIIQELRTKKTLDELAILTAPSATVIRNGSKQTIPVEEIVLDDILVLKSGDQIPSDAVVLSGELEVNESMLTGESDNIMKREDARVFAGSYATSGVAYAKVFHVGKDNYMETISAEAKKFKKTNSILRTYIEKILRVISFLIIPLSVGFFCMLFFVKGESFTSSIEQMVSAGIGMIPEGLVLLTSIALTLGVLRLARKRTLVQDLYCIETLARVDVLCLDKTGTLTEGKMKVEGVFPLASGKIFDECFSQLIYVQESSNATNDALKEYFDKPSYPWKLTKVIPFSSERKFSGASFEKEGTYYMGAQQFLFPQDKELAEELKTYAEMGLRVIVVGHSKKTATDYSLPRDLEPIGYITLSDIIRENCEDTLNYFRTQGVDLKCISGDDPLTVSKIAMKCGFQNADKYIDASTIKTDAEMMYAVQNYSVFGRVKPEQKKAMVTCLQTLGHTVAMTGDGVNDVLALKQADCSIAMASGAEATKHAANIVLLDSDFSAMPSIVKEGRRVINNICNASSMYIIKTTYSVLLTFALMIIGFILPKANTDYPFIAIQQSLISACAVAIPTFFMQLEPSFKQVQNNFMRRVFRSAVPAGVTVAVICLIIKLIFGIFGDGASEQQLSTLSVLCMGWIYFFALKRVYSPMTLYRRIVAYTMEFVYIIVMIFARNILEFDQLPFAAVMILLGAVTLSPIFIDVCESCFDSFIRFQDNRRVRKAEKKYRKRKLFEEP